MHRLACTLLVFLGYFTKLLASGSISDTARASALEFASNWFSLVSSGDYPAAYVATTEGFQTSYSLKDWTAENQKFADLAGKLVDQTFEVGSWQVDPPGAPAGAYFQVFAFASFERIDRFRMEIRLRVENGGTCRILDYQRAYIDRDTEKALREAQWKFSGARFETEKVSKEEMERYLLEITALSGWRVFPRENTLVIRDAEPDTAYIFTAPDHPAYPAVIKLREVVVQGTKGVMKSGHFAGSEAAFRSWIASVSPRGQK